MDARARISKLVAAAERLADGEDPLGREARARLPDSTGLSAENIELALTEILETRPSASELEELLTGAGAAAHVHVLLSSNVFVAAHRAIACALASSPRVTVRASRREPVFPELLRRTSGLFEFAAELCPEPGDEVHAYGSDATLAELRGTLPESVVLRAHGAGFGVALVGEASRRAAEELARDLVPFDQRGCSSPRAAIVLGSVESAREFAQHVSAELARANRRIPLGRLSADELAEMARARSTWTFAGELFETGSSFVALDPMGERLTPAPVGRNLIVVPSRPDLDWLEARAAEVVTIGVAFGSELEGLARKVAPSARVVPLGRMQRIPLDGPLDRRPTLVAR